MTKNGKQVVALYLSGKGHSARYIGSKLGVHHTTVGIWLLSRDKIEEENKENLRRHLQGFLHAGTIEWTLD